MMYTIQDRDGRGRWKSGGSYLRFYTSLEEAISMAKDLDEHGNSVRVVSFSTAAEANYGRGKVVWKAR